MTLRTLMEKIQKDRHVNHHQLHLRLDDKWHQ